MGDAAGDPPTAGLATGPSRNREGPASAGRDAGQRYLPLRPEEVVELCAQGLSDGDADRMRRFAVLLRALLHAAYRERWQQAKDAYAPFSPDTETQAQRRADAGDPGDADAQQRLVEELRSVLDAANYDDVPREVLERALGESSIFRVRLHAELDDFADLLLFRRGLAARQDTVKRWKGLRTQEIRYLEYRRVVMFARYRDRDYFTGQGRELAELPFTPGRAVLKLFQDVPENDLEMLLPNTEVRMRTFDKVIIGVPALVSGVVVATTKLATAVGLLVLLVAAGLGLREQSPELDTGTLLTLVGGLAALAAYLWRQYSKFKSRRIAFMQSLSESLYYKSVGDGPGVLFSVLDSAEEEDVKEALLAYRGLLDGPLDGAALDNQVEGLLRDRLAGQAGADSVDFEVADALGKLHRLGLVRQEGDRCVALPLPDAITALRERWHELGDALARPAGTRPAPHGGD